MEYKLIRSQRKTLAIKISSDAEIIVLSPKKCPCDFINKFLESKQDWIIKTIKSVKNKNAIVNEFKNLNKIYLFGFEYKILDYVNHYQIGNYYIKHTKSANKKNIIKKFFIKLSNEYLIDRTKQLAEILNLKFNNLEIISARKKWGSCNNLKNIKLNFRLIMLPKDLIDYVICHELYHLKELNHGKEFWHSLENLGYNKTKVKEQFTNYNFVLDLL